MPYLILMGVILGVTVPLIVWMWVGMTNADKEYRRLMEENKAIEDLFFHNLRRK